MAATEPQTSRHDEAARRLLDEERLDAMLVVGTPNLAYVAGFRVKPFERLVLLVVRRDRPLAIVVPGIEQESAQDALPADAEVLVWSDDDGPYEAVVAAVAGLPVGAAVGIEKAALTVAVYELFAKALPGAAFVDCGAALGRVRLVKDDDEIACIRRAAEIADRMMVRLVADEIRAGRSELELAETIGRIIREEGGDGFAFDPLVQIADHSAHPHGSPGQRRLARGEILLVDVGVAYAGYCADITRTFVLGEASDQQREFFTAVDAARAAGIAACAPGMRAADVDAATRGVLVRAGLDHLFIHRTGHGLGVEVHEGPQISATSEDVLETGMVFTIEPGAYLPGFGGMRIEDNVVVTESGCEVLTQAPIQLEVHA